MIVFLLLLSIVTLLFLYIKYAQTYWKRRGVNQLEPIRFPQGNSKYLTSQTIFVGAETKELYDKTRANGWKFAGIYTYIRPSLLVVDPDIIKDILQKDFQYFTDRSFYVNEKNDPLSAHIFNVGGAQWRFLRHKLTPTFTSGKMKMMFDNVLKCSEYMIEAIDKMATNQEDVLILEMAARFTTDVIGNVAYGIECNSFKDPNAEFRQMGLKIFQRGLCERMINMLLKISPIFSKAANLKKESQKINDFFLGITKSTVNYREKNNISRPDFMQLLIDLKNSNDPLTIEQIAAQVLLFFIAGFDTSSTTMNFALYELARHPDIQQKVRNEIGQVLQKHSNKITYESLSEMKYLMQVINESLRKFAPVPSLQRICVKEYKIQNTNVVIEPGTLVCISTLGLHNDPEYYEDPEKFDPERFCPENIEKRHPFVHLPFGEGPRNCIGLRFGLMQTKIGIIQILKHFELSVSPKTKQPVCIDDSVFLLKSIDPIFLKAKKIY